ncbi:replication-associated recombination protein A [Natroniella sulfidigena]|uniref:replication-associated recombination protein A n=1 Tax=Natroniella sulfidigena TaxID=723921 RepID=UPI00200B62C3|nr:replication-associated recombination protein A [Natroniella sulfidigena]MCK8815984.1 replication-associated recombination protein A [Natroniella sulfidigena]
MDLFSYQAKDNNQPLAVNLRPQTLEQFVGQEHIVGEGKLLRRAIEADRLQSLILHGPPGTGKTTLAKIIANTTVSEFESLNAVTSGVKDLREVISRAKERQGMYNKRTILFIDEIHRFNKSQQDALLPAVEEGIIILIGATTENPYFEVNSPLLSRSRIFRLQPLTEEDIKIILGRAVDKLVESKDYKVKLTPEAVDHFARVANGDARTALNALELAVLTTRQQEGVKKITLEVAEDSIQQKAINYDQTGDNHYDTISAFVKSIRGSDPDAALYWLAKMIEAGEEPMFIARRLIVHAAEDIGNADPHALVIANAAAQAVEYVGLPEARIPLAQATTYLATAPKSNSALVGINRALEAVKSKPTSGVPVHLRDNHYQGAKLGRKVDYKYPHDYHNNYVEQEYLPKELAGEKFYQPTENGYEEKIKEFLKQLE